jgi:ketopantoate reductase
MHAAVVGAGALGCVYGARLAAVARVGVTFVVRPARVASLQRMVLERVDERDDVIVMQAPDVAAEVPPHADVVIVCVRGEQLDDALAALLRRGPDVPFVMMTPMMPGDYERMRAALGDAVVAAMPGVVAYLREDGVVRYWLPRMAATLLDERRGGPSILPELARMLTRAGIHARMEMGVHESNPATTVTFAPLTMALDVGGGVTGLLADRALTTLALRAASEGAELGRSLGAVASWAGAVTKFLNRFTLRVGVGIARHQSPEAVHYVDTHFGHKLHAQNVAMAAAIVRLAEEKGTRHEALDALRERLVARGA